MSGLEKKIAALEAEVEGLKAEVKRLRGADGMDPARLLRIKAMARAEAAGDPGPRRQWNREMRRGLG